MREWIDEWWSGIEIIIIIKNGMKRDDGENGD